MLHTLHLPPLTSNADPNFERQLFVLSEAAKWFHESPYIIAELFGNYDVGLASDHDWQVIQKPAWKFCQSFCAALVGLSKKCGAVYAMHADLDDDISYVSLSFLPQLMSAFTFNSFNTCHGELFCRRVSSLVVFMVF